MKKTIYLHIGPHKTGTTTIQEGLFINIDRLLSNGILVPEKGRSYYRNAAQHNLAWELTQDANYKSSLGCWTDLLTEIDNSPAESVILSSEVFSLLMEDHIRRISTYLSSYNTVIVTYLRRQDLIIQSIWSEIIKRGTNTALPADFLTWFENSNWDFYNLDYAEYLGRWAGIFGKQNLRVGILEKSQLNGNLFQDFLMRCNVQSPAKYKMPVDSNVSPGVKTLTLIHALKNKLSGKMSSELSEAFYSIVREYAEQAGWNTTRVNFINNEIFQKIADHYQKSNSSVAQDYFKRDNLFLEPYAEKSTTSYQIGDFKPEEILDMSVYVFSELLSSGDKSEPELRNEVRMLNNQLNQIYASRSWQVMEKIRKVKKTLIG